MERIGKILIGLVNNGNDYIHNALMNRPPAKMKTSNNGIELIKSFEGCRLNAYKAVPTEKYYTIGYGHYGADVAKDAVIDMEEAVWLLKRDLEKFEEIVRDTGLALNQNQFDALVSFTYNCGGGNLKTLIRNRTLDEIGNAIPLYNKAGGKVLNGLVRRREAEKRLYFGQR